MSRERPIGAIATLSVSLLTGCAVGPDFVAPAQPDVSRYTKEILATKTASADVPKHGQSQRFINGRDIPADWWSLFRSPGLNSLVQKSIDANPTIQSAIAALRVAKENVYAQQGHYFPTVQG